MAELIYVDFLSKRVLKRDIIGREKENSSSVIDQVTLDKYSTFAELAGKGKVAVKFTPSTEGVNLPKHLLTVAQLNINFSYTFDDSNLKFNEVGVQQTLSFSGILFPVDIPWIAVTGIFSPDGAKGREWVNEVAKEMNFSLIKRDGMVDLSPNDIV